MAIKHFYIDQDKPEVNVSSIFVANLYNMCKNQDKGGLFIEFDNSSVLCGTINSGNTYQEYIDKIKEYFPLLTIIPQDLYILFEDENVLNKLLANNIGDGIGISVNSAKNISWDTNLFKNDTSITSFNKFNLFTKQQTKTTFEGCSNLVSIDLSDITGQPQNYMFKGCTSLTYIGDFQDSTITTLPVDMFRNCTSLDLRTITFPQTLKKVWYGSLANTYSTIPLESLQYIEEFIGNRDIGAFGHKNNNDAITIIDTSKNNDTLYLPNCKHVGDTTFIRQRFKYVNLPNLLTFEGMGTFRDNPNLEEVISLGNISIIGGDYSYGANGTFANCTNLKRITFPPNITELKGNMFENCTKLSYIGGLDFSNITVIGRNTFSNCNALPRVFNFNKATTFKEQTLLINQQSIYLKSLVNIVHESKYYTWSGYPEYTLFQWRSINYCSLNTLYFKNLESFEVCTFLNAIIKNVIINNTTPPTLTQWDRDLPSNAQNGNDLIFCTDEVNNRNRVDNIYVPDSAVETYKANSYYANVIDKIKPLSTCPRVTLAQANEGVSGVIEEYM